MRAAISTRLSTAERCHNRDSEKNARQEPKFNLGDYEFVYRPELGALVSDVDKETVNHLYNRLLGRTDGPKKVLSVQRHIDAIEEDSVTNNVHIDRLTLSITAQQMTDNLGQTTQITQP